MTIHQPLHISQEQPITGATIVLNSKQARREIQNVRMASPEIQQLVVDLAVIIGSANLQNCDETSLRNLATQLLASEDETLVNKIHPEDSPEIEIHVSKVPTFAENTGSLVSLPHQDMLNYLGWLSLEYRQVITSVADLFLPMNPLCKVSICIPVLATEEGECIYKTLESYCHQTIGAEDFEIVCLANHPDIGKSGERLLPDQTLFEIERFSKDHPEITVRTAYVTFDHNYVTIGYIRAVLNDVVMLRHLERGAKDDHIVVRNDADTQGLHPQYLENFLDLFDQNPNVASFHGRLDYAPTSCINDPYVYITNRLSSLLSAHEKQKNGQIGTGGANVAMRLRYAALTGGYNSHSKFGEDVDFDRSLRELGQQKDIFIPSAPAGRKSVLFTHPRRARAAINSGFSSIEQWSHPEIAFGAENTAIRKAKENVHHGSFSALEDPEFVNNLEKFINRTLRCFLSESDEKQNIRLCERFLRAHLGIDFEMSGKYSVRVLGVDKLKEQLRTLWTNAQAKERKLLSQEKASEVTKRYGRRRQALHYLIPKKVRKN